MTKHGETMRKGPTTDVAVENPRKEQLSNGEDLECGATTVPLTKDDRRRPAHSSSCLLYLAIVLAGCVLASILLYFGISNARDEVSRQLDLDGTELAGAFGSLWQQYEMASLWALQTGEASGLFERYDFYEVDQNLKSLGVEYASLAYCIRLKHEDREEYERKARAFYSKEGKPNYPGISVITRKNGNFTLEISPEKPFYNPCPYGVLTEGLGFLATAEVSSTVQFVKESPGPGKPVLFRVLDVPRIDGTRSRFVTMGQPGRNAEFTANITRFSFITIDCDALLRRLVSTLPKQQRRVSVYMFDSPLGQWAANIGTIGLGADSFLTRYVSGARTLGGSADSKDQAENLEPIDIETVRSWKHGYKFEHIVNVCDREWTLIVYLDRTEVDLELGFVSLAASMIVFVCCVLALWLKTSHDRRLKLDEIRRANEAERASLEVQNAKKKVANERELNGTSNVATGQFGLLRKVSVDETQLLLDKSLPHKDFVAHEVRNPLAAALSAASFVSASLDDAEAMRTEKGRLLAKDDLSIVDSSLHFINDLLRNMLDLHRASANQLLLAETPTALLDDVLQPVVTMLYCRGPNVSVSIECPSDLAVSVDRIRLKQIVLNLARNSVKFVVNGFVRIRAAVDDSTRSVVINIEDSGPGIPVNKRHQLFNKFQESLDSLHQGTG